MGRKCKRVRAREVECDEKIMENLQLIVKCTLSKINIYPLDSFRPHHSKCVINEYKTIIKKKKMLSQNQHFLFKHTKC